MATMPLRAEPNGGELIAPKAVWYNQQIMSCYDLFLSSRSTFIYGVERDWSMGFSFRRGDVECNI